MVFKRLSSGILCAHAELRCQSHYRLYPLQLKGLREIIVIAGWGTVRGFTLFNREQQLLSRQVIHHAIKPKLRNRFLLGEDNHLVPRVKGNDRRFIRVDMHAIRIGFVIG